MKRAAFIFIGVLVLVIVAAFFWSPTINKPSNNSVDIQVEKPPTVETTQLIIYNCEKGKSAFDILLEKFPNTKTEDSSLGKFVTSINGMKQGNGKYWLYSIDNKEATIGATQYFCQDQETINWNLK